MADDQVIIEHADGRRYSVTRDAHARLYPDFAITGDETPADFVVTGIPQPKAKRSHARRKAALPLTQPEEPDALDG